MASRSDELQEFKRIDLVQYAVSRGFSVDRRASSKSSVVVRHSCGDKLIISRDSSGTYFYFNAKGNDSGTIIDLVQSLDGGSLGDVRKTLRVYRPSTSTIRDAEPSNVIAHRKEADRSVVKNAWQNARPLEGGNTYLSDCRAIPEKVYLDNAFEGRLKIDSRGNILAAHHDHDGLSGFEMKNGTKDKTTFTGFSPGGSKGLFYSNGEEGNRTIVLAETFIDALSVATITGISGRRFFSLGGNPSPSQMELLRSLVKKSPRGTIVEMRFDNDKAGLELAARLSAEVFAEASNLKCFRYIPPKQTEADWNDVLRQPGSLQEKWQADRIRNGLHWLGK